ncbi:MAG: hypothetical protein WBE13_10925 [Candidatus Acidiferrum sp.]
MTNSYPAWVRFLMETLCWRKAWPRLYINSIDEYVATRHFAASSVLAEFCGGPYTGSLGVQRNSGAPV